MSPYAARIRAARLYKDLTQAELAEALGIDEKTVIRREAGAQDPKRGELIAIAGICGVPTSFMLQGFGEPTRDEIVERLERIEAALGGLVNYDELEARMRDVIQESAGPAATTPPAHEPAESTSDLDDSRPADQPPREESG